MLLHDNKKFQPIILPYQISTIEFSIIPVTNLIPVTKQNMAIDLTYNDDFIITKLQTVNISILNLSSNPKNYMVRRTQQYILLVCSQYKFLM